MEKGKRTLVKKADGQKNEKFIAVPLSCSFSRLGRLSNGFLTNAKEEIRFNKPFNKIFLLLSHLEHKIVSPHPSHRQP